jgi:Na+(H+)/acetate symporter ActP
MTATLAAIGDFNGLAVAIFAVVLAITLAITWWAARRTRNATEFYTAGRGVAGAFNGIAIAGDYLSASTFLGYAGLMFLFGFDGWIIGLAAMLSFLPVLYLLADRMRNAGKFTVADVLAYRLRRRPVRVAAAINALLISGIYLTAQLVGAGSLIEALAGISFAPAVLICGVFMVIYVVFGGMLATTWVQIIKAGMLMTAGVVVSVAVLAKFNFSPSELLDKAAAGARGRPQDPRPGHLSGHARAGDLDRPDDLHRHRGAAAHPHAVLHRAQREGRTRVGAVDDRDHRRVHGAGDRDGLRIAGDPRVGRRGGRRQGRQPRRPAAGPEPGWRRRDGGR